MLTNIKILNFKRLQNVEFELGKSVLLIGPNNSGKSTALQALALWNIGLRQWVSKRSGSAEKKGVTINRRDLISIPIPMAKLLWNGLHVRNVERTKEGKPDTANIRIGIIVEGITNDVPWSCGLEFDYANEESFYCRPLLSTDGSRSAIPKEALEVQIAFLPPMSGLAPSEFKLEAGGINVLLGEGQTAQVLRNLCFFIYEKTSSTNKDWANVAEHIRKLFGITLLPPKYITERGEITMSYKEHNITLDISSSGRGLQQTLLLLAHLYANPKTVLLLDEPDAHLEYLRKQEIYRLLTELSEKQGSQVISASHSTAVLNEAADRDIVIAFVGKPHRIDDRGTQTTKALKSIGFEHYYLAEETGWVLYLEGSTDLAMLKAFADTLEHDAASLLERPFVHWVENKPENVFSHFFGVSDAKKDLVGIAIFDRMDKVFEPKPNLTMLSWSRRELENYLCMEEVLLAYARYDLPDDLFGRPEAAKREQAMRDAISEVGTSLKTLRNLEPWSPDTKASDDFLDPLFRIYFAKLKLTNILRKTDYHVLAHLVPKDKIDVEIIEKLDAIVAVAKMAHPVGE